MSQPQPQPATNPQPPPPPADDDDNNNNNTHQQDEPKYGGYTRFEIELEFVQSLANPLYLNHLASQKLLQQPAFVAWLAYLRYWRRPPYAKYLTYPGPALKHLELLQEERFRRDVLSPDLVAALVAEGGRAAVEWHRGGEGDR